MLQTSTCKVCSCLTLSTPVVMEGLSTAMQACAGMASGKGHILTVLEVQRSSSPLKKHHHDCRS